MSHPQLYVQGVEPVTVERAARVPDARGGALDAKPSSPGTPILQHWQGVAAAFASRDALRPEVGQAFDALTNKIAEHAARPFTTTGEALKAIQVINGAVSNFIGTYRGDLPSALIETMARFRNETTAAAAALTGRQYVLSTPQQGLALPWVQAMVSRVAHGSSPDAPTPASSSTSSRAPKTPPRPWDARVQTDDLGVRVGVFTPADGLPARLEAANASVQDMLLVINTVGETGVKGAVAHRLLKTMERVMRTLSETGQFELKHERHKPSNDEALVLVPNDKRLASGPPAGDVVDALNAIAHVLAQK